MLTRLKRLRPENGLSGKGLAQAVDTYGTLISAVERGWLACPVRLRTSLAGLFQVPEERLFSSEGMAR
jgi:DNA-binding XRE family transcriptional regulator